MVVWISYHFIPRIGLLQFEGCLVFSFDEISVLEVLDGLSFESLCLCYVVGRLFFISIVWLY